MDSTLLLESKRKRSGTLLLICLEKNYYKNDRIKTAIEHLKEIIPNNVSIADYHECEQWLRTYNGDQRIVLIISDTFGKQIVPHIQDLSAIDAIYVYCEGSKSSSQWTEKYSKAHGAVSDFSQLIQQISMDLKYGGVTENQSFHSLLDKPICF